MTYKYPIAGPFESPDSDDLSDIKGRLLSSMVKSEFDVFQRNIF